MQKIEIHTPDDPRILPYTALTERQLLQRQNPQQGIFICESPKVILTAIHSGHQPQSLLCEERHLTGDAAEIIRRSPKDMPVYVGKRQTLATITGYTLTRGVLCAMRRPDPLCAADICRTARRIAVLDGVVDATNIGAIFRSAAALGIEAVLLSHTCCDALNRRAVRVSMGSVFLLPWARIEPQAGRTLVDQLHALGFTVAATALRPHALSPDTLAAKAPRRLAIVMGGEGYGLEEEVITQADHVICIPMQRGVDSLNVAAAGAIVFYALCT